VVCVRSNVLAVRIHELDCDDVVGRQTVAPPEPADAAAERVTDDSDVRRRTGERCQTMLGGCLADFLPQDSGFHAPDAPFGIDLHPAHPLGLDEDGVCERPHRAGGVPGALRSNPKAARPRPAHDRGNVFGRLGQRNGRRLLVNSKVPSTAGLVPFRIVRQHERFGLHLFSS
jgi:hypothetical protein